MKSFSSRKLSLVLALVTVACFLITFLILYLTRGFFPYSGLRNRDYGPAKLENCMHIVYDKEMLVIDNICFENKKENIYVEITADARIVYNISGFNGTKIKETGTMIKKDDNHSYYCFNYDYFDIDNIMISLSEICYINEVNVYYLK